MHHTQPAMCWKSMYLMSSQVNEVRDWLRLHSFWVVAHSCV